MLAPGCGEPWFPHTAVLLSLTCLSYGDLFVLFLVLLFSFQYNSLDDAQVIISQPYWPGQLSSCRLWFFVCLVCLVFACVFCLFALVFCLFSVILSARDDAIGPCKVNL